MPLGRDKVDDGTLDNLCELDGSILETAYLDCTFLLRSSGSKLHSSPL